MQVTAPKLLLPRSDTRLSLGIVVAMGLDREIGQNGTMPWYVPEDLKHFKQQTLNSCVIMGRRTFESIGRPLPSRRNIVITRNTDLSEQHRVEVASSLDEALDLAHDPRKAQQSAMQHKIDLQSTPVAEYSECFVIGGARLFAEALNQADKVVITLLNAQFPDADVFFPQLPEGRFQLQHTEPQSGFLISEAKQPLEFAQIRSTLSMEYRFETYRAK